MIITREIINKNIKFHDVHCVTGRIFSYDYDKLSKAIDLYKNFLLEHNVKPQDNVVIVEQISMWQIAAIIASCELGLKISIFDFLKSSTLSYKYNRIDSKTEKLLPIHYFIVPKSYKLDDDEEHNISDDPKVDQNNDWYIKVFYCDKISENSIIRTFDNEDLNDIIPNNKIYAQKDFIVAKTTTSGTTGSPKLIEHSHEFVSDLIERNSKWFSGNYFVFSNLNHGSSMFCYAIPALASKNVTDYYNLTYPNIDMTVKTLSECNGISNIMLPYASVTEQLLHHTKKVPLPNVKLHVLGNIKKEWVDNYYKKELIGNIISNFGSNETTGPIFINEASDENFSETKYTLFDDYFTTKISNNGLEVFMPVYNKWIATKDNFEPMQNGSFQHKGRLDLLRINDIEIDEKKYQSVVDEYFLGDLIYDQIKSEIYLAIWKNIPDFEKQINNLKQKIEQLSGGMHSIGKYAILEYDEFLSGIKLDKEMIREYFRNNV
jgi:hypothetical protein